MSRPEQVAEIFTEEPERNGVTIVSAIGKEPFDGNGCPKVTDALIDLERAVDKSDHIAIAEAQEFVLARNRQVYSMLAGRALDRVVDDAYKLMRPEARPNGFQWIGEYLSARLLAELTGALYLPSDLRFSGGVVQVGESVRAIRKQVAPFVRAGRQVVVPGFFGYDNTTGALNTLPRGGSDTSGVIYTGALLNQGLGGWINENYTDKDGVLSADPDIVPQAHVIPEMTHDEMREKMHGITERNGVVHGDAIAYAARMGVEMQVKNTFNADAAGTRITSNRCSDPDHPVIGVTGKADLVAISTYDIGMADAENYVSPILTKIGELGMSWSNIPTGEDRLKIIFNSGVTEENLLQLREYIQANTISGEKSKVTIKRDQGAVYVIGQELVDPLTYTSILGRVATQIAKAGLSMREVISHEESPSLALTVQSSEVRRVIEILHAELLEN